MRHLTGSDARGASDAVEQGPDDRCRQREPGIRSSPYADAGNAAVRIEERTARERRREYAIQEEPGASAEAELDAVETDSDDVHCVAFGADRDHRLALRRIARGERRALQLVQLVGELQQGEIEAGISHEEARGNEPGLVGDDLDHPP